LRDIERRYGVEPSVMMAIFGHETSYGVITGDFDLLNSLASLAYEGRRRDLFADEFIATLKMMDRGYSRSQLKGSWAGATGYPQFLPSVYLRVAADGDGDGRANIWSSQLDALASIANYLSNAGWKRDVHWGVPARVPDSFSRAGLSTLMTAPRCPRVYERHSRWRTVANGAVSASCPWVAAPCPIRSLRRCSSRTVPARPPTSHQQLPHHPRLQLLELLRIVRRPARRRDRALKAAGASIFDWLMFVARAAGGVGTSEGSISTMKRKALLFALFSTALALPATAAAPPFDTPAPVAFMKDLASGAVLYAKDPDRRIPPASMAKMMTTHLAFHLIKQGELKLDKVCTVQPETWRKVARPAGRARPCSCRPASRSASRTCCTASSPCPATTRPWCSPSASPAPSPPLPSA
jgi:hypothetical protein